MQMSASVGGVRGRSTGSTGRSVLRVWDVAARLDTSKPTIYRWLRAGTFPKPHRLSEYSLAVGWFEEEIAAYERARAQ